MATIITVVENLALPFDVVYSKVTYEGSKEELLNKIEFGTGMLRFVYEGPDHKLHELVTRGENILSLEFPVEGAGVPAGIKPAPKKLEAKAENIIPFPIRDRLEQPPATPPSAKDFWKSVAEAERSVKEPQNEKPTSSLFTSEILAKIAGGNKEQAGPRVIVATPEQFMADTGMSEEEFFHMLSSLGVAHRPTM